MRTPLVRSLRHASLGFLLAVAWATAAVQQAKALVWHKISSPNLVDITFGAGQWVALGADGAVFVSADATNWISVAPGVSLGGVEYAGSQFIGLTAGGKIFTSLDGRTWAAHDSGVTDTLQAVAFGNGTYVAVGPNIQIPSMFARQVIVTSTDGNAWKVARNEPLNEELLGVAFGNGRFVAVGNDNSVWSSTNGANWSLSAWIPLSTNSSKGVLKSVTFTGEQFVTVGVNFVGGAATYDFEIATSSDGVSWEIRSSPNTAGFLSDVCYGGGRSLAVGGPNQISVDGITWTDEPINGAGMLSRVAYGQDTFVAVGAGAVFQSDPLMALKFTDVRRSSDRSLAFKLTSPWNATLEGSSNLIDWQSLSVVTNATSGAVLQNLRNDSAQRFVRARLGPSAP